MDISVSDEAINFSEIDPWRAQWKEAIIIDTCLEKNKHHTWVIVHFEFVIDFVIRWLIVFIPVILFLFMFTGWSFSCG